MNINGRDLLIHKGLPATVHYGSDAYPAKVVGIQETQAFLVLDLEEYPFRATPAGIALGDGHQDWEIQWDKPQKTTRAKIRKSNGKYVGDHIFSSITLGHASPNFCWEV